MNFNEQTIKITHLPILQKTNRPSVITEIKQDGDIEKLSDVLDKAEEDYIRSVYLRLNKNKTKTAQYLGISIRNLYYKMEKYNIVN
jgi:transcriptional regulator with PAS, ATPase and Fis domain